MKSGHFKQGLFFYHIFDHACPSSLYSIIQEKQAAMASLESEVQRLAYAMSTRTSGIEKREHPLEPVIHIVDDRGTSGTNIGRHASMVGLNSIDIAFEDLWHFLCYNVVINNA